MGHNLLLLIDAADSGGGRLEPPPFPFLGGRLSVQAISWVIDQSKHKGNSFVVLLMIANHARSDGTGAWPSVRTIAKECRLSERTVQRCIIRLSRHLWSFPPELRVQKCKGPYGSNLYEIPGVKLSPPRRQSVTDGVSDTVTTPVTQLSPNPSLTVLKEKDTHISLIKRAIQESEKTGEEADSILKRLREGISA